MRILKDFKIPNFKFPKFKMEGIEIDEVNIDLEKAEKHKAKKEIKNYEPTHYETIKEIFLRSQKEYKDCPLILEKPDHKEPYKEITYKEFCDDVIHLGTALIKFLGLKDKRVVIVSETTYDWYVSYMAMLCGVGIAVPTDKELPNNELENVIKRSKAEAVIYSAKKKDAIKKIREGLPNVKYFIQMNEENPLEGKDIGFNHLLYQGKQLVENGIHS